VFRKPLAGTVAANVTAHGTGAINVDACRIGTEQTVTKSPAANDATKVYGAFSGGADTTNTGRWPANVVLSHEESCADECAPGCAVAALDAQSGDTVSVNAPRGRGLGYGGGNGSDVVGRGFNDTGGASRFFFCAKPSTAERESGLGHRKRAKVSDGRATPNDSPRLRDATERANVHPTVKSIALMRWLCRLVTPPGGVVLDVFAGSGTTAVACSQEGLRFVGCEREAEYVGIARDRLLGDAPLLNAGGGL